VHRENREETSKVNRLLQLAAICAALIATTTLPAPAQQQRRDDYQGTEEQQRACRPNVFRLCASDIPDARRITDCLRRNYVRLTPDCAAVFADEQPRRRRR
jgi:hypothetical protein